MTAERAVIEPEPNGWDKIVPCSFKNLQSYKAREIIYKNLIHYFKWTNFETFLNQTDENEYLFECTRDEANVIRNNLHLILTSAHNHVWFTINTDPLHTLQEKRVSDQKQVRNPPLNVSFSFGSMYSTELFYRHTQKFHHTGIIKVWMERSRATSLIISICSSNTRIIIPIQSIQKTLLVNRGEMNQPIQVVLMLNSAVKIEETLPNDNKAYARIGNEEKPDSLTDILSKSSDLLLQFDPPVNAWTFLLNLPIIGHTENNKRQDGNFQINFAVFKSENWPHTDPIRQHGFNSFKSRYSIEMLQSLGYVFSDKYTASSAIQNSFRLIENVSPKKFHGFCSTLYKALKSDHCLSVDDLIKTHLPNKDKTESIRIDMASVDDRYVSVRHITITPTRVILKPFCREIGNRALRRRGVEKYIRVHIREENDEMLDVLPEKIRSRFKRKMLHGFECMDKVYYCIGSSTSQMKNFSYWFTTLNEGETIDQVRAQFGDFTNIKNVATYVARVGLYFSTSSSTGIHLKYIDSSTIAINMPEPVLSESLSFSVRGWIKARWWSGKSTPKPVFQEKYVVHLISDIKENGFCFTDGCGLISLGLAQEVAEKIGLSIKQLNDIPSVFQIRMAGCKGILMIDPESAHDDYYIKIRHSMVKFPSNDWTLDICDYSRFMRLSLNNQVIRLLSDLGNGIGVFESLQNRASKSVLWHAPEEAHLNVFESELVHDQESRYLDVRENLLRNRIPLAVNEARNMFGVADVTGKLEYGQCFIQYQTGTEKKKVYQVVKGTVLVTKNPCLYPGDIRRLVAIDVPNLRHCMRDCIVFPTKGPRPHSDEISGSDLDGDQYWVYWGTDLKIIEPVPPLSHSAGEKAIVPDITNEMVVDYFLNTVDNSSYSLIADVHTVVADQEEKGTLSKECVLLAVLFYRAIDSPKTGEMIDMAEVLKLRDAYCESFPKFMMKFGQSYYQSSSILEKLYLTAKKISLSKAKRESYEKYHITTTFERRVLLSAAVGSNLGVESIQSSFLYKYLPILRYIWSYTVKNID